MCFADIGDDAAVGRDDVAEQCDFSNVVGTGFDDSKFVFLREAEQREGHTDVVVEIAFGVEHIESLGEHGSHEFFGCGLAVSACDLKNWGFELSTMVGSQYLKGCERVVHQDATFVLLGNVDVVYHCVGTSSFEGLECKLVAIETSTFEGEKQAVFHQMARVGGDVWVTKIEFVEFCYRHERIDLSAKVVVIVEKEKYNAIICLSRNKKVTLQET